jgi:hypothetical protein
MTALLVLPDAEASAAISRVIKENPRLGAFHQMDWINWSINGR